VNDSPPPAKVERWPPVYDAEQLARQIEELAGRGDLHKAVYDVDLARGGPVCQGDVVSLDTDLPVVDELGRAATRGDFRYWLVIGNTCDFHRSDVLWSQVVPVVLVPPSEMMGPKFEGVRTYGGSRTFHLPPWLGSDGSHGVANLLTPVAIDKRCLGEVAKVEARLSEIGWVLLHSCLVRFLARDDGRFD
jgi:hypothetical protein